MWRFGPPLLFILMHVPATAGAWVPSTTCIDEPPEAPTQIPFCQGDEFPRVTLWPTPRAEFWITDRAPSNIDSARGPIPPELENAIRSSFEVWNQPDCSAWNFSYQGKTDIDALNVTDGTNIVVIHDVGEWPYASAGVALTSVSWDRNTADIVSADMELNNDDHLIQLDAEGSTTAFDLRNTVTHEAGHFLGLAHSPVDGATMIFDAPEGQVSKRDLHPDDIEGLCELYPVGSDEPPANGGEPKGCCSTSVASGSSAGWLAILLVFATLRRRR